MRKWQRYKHGEEAEEEEEEEEEEEKKEGLGTSTRPTKIST